MMNPARCAPPGEPQSHRPGDSEGPRVAGVAPGVDVVHERPRARGLIARDGRRRGSRTRTFVVAAGHQPTCRRAPHRRSDLRGIARRPFFDRQSNRRRITAGIEDRKPRHSRGLRAIRVPQLENWAAMVSMSTPMAPDALFHYSEDPNIRLFDPHVPRTNPTAAPSVWAVDPAHAALYWFPRDCPRVAVWCNTEDQRERLHRRFVTRSARVQAAPVAWLDPMRRCELFEYRFEPSEFEPWTEAEGQWVAHRRVVPVSVEPVGDLLERQAAADIELRFVTDLAPLRHEVLTAGLPFSIVRFGGAGRTTT